MASAGRLTEDAAARLSKQYRSEIAHRYSYEFTRWMARPVRLVLDRFFLSEVIVGIVLMFVWSFWPGLIIALLIFILLAKPTGLFGEKTLDKV